MLRRTLLGCLVLGLAGLSIFCLTQPAAHAANPKKKLLFFTRSQGFQHSVVKVDGDKPCYAETVLRPICQANNWDLDVTKDGTVFEPGSIEKYDAFLFYTTGDLTAEESKDGSKPMSKEGKVAFLKAIEDGKGWLGFHCASDTFHAGERYQTQPVAERDPYINMIGGEFIVHGAQQPSTMQVIDPNFPGADKVAPSFNRTEEWYALKNFADNLHVILMCDTKDMKGGMYQRPPYPATWARMYGKGRVFYTSMGHREDMWISPEFSNVVIGGIKWITHEVSADVTPNISKFLGTDTVPPQEIKPPKAAPAKKAAPKKADKKK